MYPFISSFKHINGFVFFYDTLIDSAMNCILIFNKKLNVNKIIVYRNYSCRKWLCVRLVVRMRLPAICATCIDEQLGASANVRRERRRKSIRPRRYEALVYGLLANHATSIRKQWSSYMHGELQIICMQVKDRKKILSGSFKYGFTHLLLVNLRV